MPARRVHFLITDLQIGGTPRVVKELALRLRAFDIEPKVACLAPWGPVADELQAAGVSVEAFGARGTRDLPRTIQQARSWLADADVAMSFLVHANAIAAWALRGTSVPLIQSIQTTQPRPAWHWWLQGLVGRSARRIVVPSSSVVAAAVDRSGLAAEQIVVIPNAVDVPDELPSRTPSSPFRVGFLGRLDPVKRVTDLVDAVARLPNVTLSIYGEGPDRSAIERAIRTNRMEQQVTLHGQYSSAVEALEKIDLLVLPSDAEGFGLVLIEAMAAGIPVIATRVPGIVDVVRDGETGVLVPPRNPAALAETIRHFADDPKRCRAFAERAFEDVRSRFTWDSVLPQYARLLHAV